MVSAQAVDVLRNLYRKDGNEEEKGARARNLDFVPRVPRELLWEVLDIFGVPMKLIRLLKALHANAEVKFVVNDITKRIESIIGVKQGDILRSFSFSSSLQ